MHGAAWGRTNTARAPRGCGMFVCSVYVPVFGREAIQHGTLKARHDDVILPKFK
jgi:hypothetical protein